MIVIYVPPAVVPISGEIDMMLAVYSAVYVTTSATSILLEFLSFTVTLHEVGAR